MKIPSAILLLFLCLSAYLYVPGGRLNRHRWYSQVVHENYAKAKADYDKCMATEPGTQKVTFNEYPKFCPSPVQSSVIEINLVDQGNPKNDACVVIDFCIRHGESRVISCEWEKQ